MKEKIEKHKYIILIILVLATTFYWYELRPVQIRKECAIKSCLSSNSNGFSCYGKSTSFKEQQYSSCLRENGLEK